MKTSIEYSTMPRALRGANWMSVMIALAGSVGSTSPEARIVSFSYAPTVPNVIPPKVGDSSRTTWSWVMRASLTLATQAIAPMASAARANDQTRMRWPASPVVPKNT